MGTMNVNGFIFKVERRFCLIGRVRQIALVMNVFCALGLFADAGTTLYGLSLGGHETSSFGWPMVFYVGLFWLGLFTFCNIGIQANRADRWVRNSSLRIMVFLVFALGVSLGMLFRGLFTLTAALENYFQLYGLFLATLLWLINRD
jgi:hypothetical protein